MRERREGSFRTTLGLEPFRQPIAEECFLYNPLDAATRNTREAIMNPSPYKTEAERTEARRKTYRESKQRKAEERKRTKSAIESYVTLLITRGNGPAWRREMMIDILHKQRGQ